MTLSMRFRTAPILVANLSATDVAAGGNMGRVLEITEPNLINVHSLSVFAPLDKYVVRFDIFIDQLSAQRA